MKAAIAGTILIILVGLWIIQKKETPEDQTNPSANIPEVEIPHPQIETPDQPPTPVLADTMLAGYGSDESSGKEDLLKLATLLDSVFLLVKNRDSADYSTNEDLVLFLKGENPHRAKFLNDPSPALNQNGQLIDRWGSPIIVHPISRKLLEIRSAGPDKQAYTEDDFTWPEPK